MLVRFQVLKAVIMKMTVFWDVLLCSQVEIGKYSDDGDIKHLWNVSQFLPDYMMQDPKIQSCSFIGVGCI
jgi:hypothetical protein